MNKIQEVKQLSIGDKIFIPSENKFIELIAIEKNYR